MKECTCQTVTRNVMVCQIMAHDLQDCVVCRVCDLHFHPMKGTRTVLPARPMPWTPPKEKKLGSE